MKRNWTSARFFGFILVLTLLGSVPATAQAVAPFRSEYRKQAKGMLTLINDKDVAVRVTLRPQSFTSDDEGHLKQLPLDPDLHLILSQASLEIPPHQTRYVTYEAKPKSLPAWFMIYTNFTPEASGFVIGTAMPHFAYITGGDPKSNEIQVSAVYTNATQALKLSFVNRSRQLAHFESVQISGGQNKNLGGLSILPGKSTVVTAKLEGKTPPRVVIARGGKLKVQCAVAVQ